MSQDEQKWTRSELYEAVWIEPMRRLAQRLGVSDVALAKTCRRHNIPVPARGHWAKAAAGKTPPKPELPPLEGGGDPVVLHARTEPRTDSRSETPSDPELQQLLAAYRPSEPITVPDDLHNATTAVRRTVRALKRAKPDERGIVRAGGAGMLHLAVTHNSVDRAARIADAFVLACQAQGLMTKSRRSDAEFTVQLEGQTLPFTISEKVTRSERSETAAERRRRERHPYLWDRRPLYEYHPTGQLTLRFDHSADGARASWSDGKTQRLENLLSDALAGAVRIAVLRRRWQEDFEAKQRARQEALRLRQARERQEADEQRRCEALLREVERWETANRLRSYIAAVERKGALGEEQLAWIHWGDQVARALDPTHEDPLDKPASEAVRRIKSDAEEPGRSRPANMQWRGV